jgi:hypothetical protein
MHGAKVKISSKFLCLCTIFASVYQSLKYWSKEQMKLGELNRVLSQVEDAKRVFWFDCWQVQEILPFETSRLVMEPIHPHILPPEHRDSFGPEES